MHDDKEFQIKALKTLIAIIFAALAAPFVMGITLRNPIVYYGVFFVSDYVSLRLMVECIRWMSRLGLFWLVFRYWVLRRPW